MGLFSQRKPRPFTHHYIYVDERKERMKEIETRAKRELGMLPQAEDRHENIRGAFSHGRNGGKTDGTAYGRNADEGRLRRSIGMSSTLMVFIIVAMLALIYWLMIGIY